MKGRYLLDKQGGLSLPEALLATLLLSVFLLGLLNYYQSLSESFIRQQQAHQAWLEAQNQLENYAVFKQAKALTLPGWLVQITSMQTTEACQQVTARVETPLGYVSRLNRWICRRFDE